MAITKELTDALKDIPVGSVAKQGDRYYLKAPSGSQSLKPGEDWHGVVRGEDREEGWEPKVLPTCGEIMLWRP